MKQLDICSGTSLAHIPAHIFSNALVRLERIHLIGTVLTAAQIETVLVTITLTEDLTLSHLSLLALDASSVDGEILCGAISRLEVVELLDTTLTPGQLASIFQLVATREHNISTISSFSHTIAGLIIGTQTHLYIYDMYIAVDIFRPRKHSKLRKIYLKGHDIGSVPTELVEKATNNEEVTIFGIS